MGGRLFYEGIETHHPDHPTRDRFEVVTTPDCGEALASKVAFRAGDVVFRIGGPILESQNLYTLQLGPDRFVYDPFVAGKIMHHCEPNMRLDIVEQTFRAIKDIAPGDLLTMDYETTEDYLFRGFDCECDAAHCRMRIEGKVPSVLAGRL